VKMLSQFNVEAALHRHVARQTRRYNFKLRRYPNLTCQGKLSRISAEVHAGWCPSGTSNPAVPIISGRSVRFRHTSATTTVSRSINRLKYKIYSGRFFRHFCALSVLL